MLENLDKVKVGHVFKSLKDMIRFFGLEGEEGNSKVANLKLISHFIEWEKVAHSQRIIVTKIKNQ